MDILDQLINTQNQLSAEQAAHQTDVAALKMRITRLADERDMLAQTIAQYIEENADLRRKLSDAEAVRNDEARMWREDMAAR